jgi:hypothetical protein
MGLKDLSPNDLQGSSDNEAFRELRERMCYLGKSAHTYKQIIK